MRLGFNLLLWTAHVGPEHRDALTLIRDAGYDGVEIPLGLGDEAHYRALGAILDDLGLARTCVTSLEPHTNPVSPDAGVRAAAVERLKWAADMCKALGSERLCGPFHSAYKVFSGGPATDDERDRSAEVLHAGADYAQSLGLPIAFEVLNRFECYLVNTMAEGVDLVRRADHPNLGVHYDTHHAHIEEKSIPAALETAGAHLAHVHVSESDRGTPGSGQVDWSTTLRTLRALGYDDWLTVESFSRADPAFANAIHVWRDYDAVESIVRDGARFLREAWDRAGS